MWAKMRKSLGEKRRYLTDEQIAEITRLHGSMETASSPSWSRSSSSATARSSSTARYGRAGRSARRPGPTSSEDKALAKLGADMRDAIVDRLVGLARRVVRRRRRCCDAIRSALVTAGLAKPPAAAPQRARRPLPRPRPRRRTSARRKGRVVADAELRDTENVPLTEDVEDYIAREVRPTSPTPGSTTTKARSGTRSRSPGCSTSTRRRGQARTSRRSCASARQGSVSCSKRSWYERDRLSVCEVISGWSAPATRRPRRQTGWPTRPIWHDRVRSARGHGTTEPVHSKGRAERRACLKVARLTLHPRACCPRGRIARAPASRTGT